jgi:hypothetical protein
LGGEQSDFLPIANQSGGGLVLSMASKALEEWEREERRSWGKKTRER